MNRILDPLRGVVNDLVEKRLWPIAVALLVALVAVPVLLGSSDSDAGDTSPDVAAPAAADVPRAAVQLAEERTAKVNRKGKVSDPFYNPPDEKVVTEGGVQDTAGVTPPAGDPALSAGGTSTPDAGPTTPVNPTTPDQPKAAPKKTVYPSFYDRTLAVNLRFGETGSIKNLRGVDPLTPLPSVVNPFFVFEGVKRGTTTARFLVSENVKATGDGKCLPSPKSCQMIDLEPGDSQYFDLKTDGGRLVQYQLDYVSMSKLSKQQTIALAARSVYGARVRFGAKPPVSTQKLGRLAALGGSADPVAQYLGVAADKASAVFVLAPGSKLVSDEFCLDGDACRTFALRRGGVASVLGANGKVYGVRVVSIERSQARSAKVARLARHDASDSGRAVLKRLLADSATADSIGQLRYSPVLGTVSRAG